MNKSNSFLDDLPPVLLVKEVADILGVTRTTLYRMIKAGKIRAVRVGTTEYRIPKDAFIEYLEGSAVAVEPANVKIDASRAATAAETIAKPEKSIVYCVEDLISILGVSRNTAYELVRSGKIRAVIIGNNRYRIPKEALDEYLAGSAVKSKGVSNHG